jgi:hypothetical protein
MKTLTQAEALEYYKSIVNLAQDEKLIVPVMSVDRFISRKEQARLVRELFKRLGIRGLSVTAPNYSMASTVHINLPNFHADFTGYAEFQNETWSCIPSSCPVKICDKARCACRTALDSILLRAFPNHGDRSDVQSDYFDSCWSIS